MNAEDEGFLLIGALLLGGILLPDILLLETEVGGLIPEFERGPLLPHPGLLFFSSSGSPCLPADALSACLIRSGSGAFYGGS